MRNRKDGICLHLPGRKKALKQSSFQAFLISDKIQIADTCGKADPHQGKGH